jgi:hypothetical protein
MSFEEGPVNGEEDVPAAAPRAGLSATIRVRRVVSTRAGETFAGLSRTAENWGCDK